MKQADFSPRCHNWRVLGVLVPFSIIVALLESIVGATALAPWKVSLSVVVMPLVRGRWQARCHSTLWPATENSEGTEGLKGYATSAMV